MTTIGPDKTFPFGEPIREGDLGGLNVEIRIIKESRLLTIDFGTITISVAARPQKMQQLATVLREQIHQAFGEMRYDKSTLPIRVIANSDKRVIELHFPAPVGILGANPEMWLALAEVIEENIAKLPLVH